MQGLTSRERRWPVLVDAQVRLDGAWLPARLHNISAHGLLLASKASIPRGSYVEVRARGIRAVGRVVWKRGEYSGVRTQDAIDLIPVLGFGGGEPENRAQHKAAAGEAATTGALNRWVARFRLLFAAAVLIAAAASVGYGVSRLFAKPLDGARQAMETR